MKLDCVLTAVNENKLYLDFCPLFIKTWKKLYPDVDVKIILTGNEIPTELSEYKNNFIIYKPPENISTAFISQYIRMLYPCILEYKNGVMITDIDMLPMNKNYYTQNIKDIDNNKFIYLRENIYFRSKQIAMCYNVALPSTWKNIFNIASLNDINCRLKKVFNSIKYVDGHGLSGWAKDQQDLYKYVLEWNKKTNDFFCLKDKDTKFCRLDRETFDIDDENIRNNISQGLYTDYHCLRPMSEYSKINDIIHHLL